LADPTGEYHYRAFGDEDGKPARLAAGERIMLTQIWLTQPLAFARVGASPTPSDAFMWNGNDLTPDGSGQTTLAPAETINLDAEGVPTGVKPDRVVFRDQYGIRPVCPYFELHGTWTENGRRKSGPVTAQVLDKFGVKPKDIAWDIHCAQLKAFHYTYDDADRIDAVLQLRGDDTTRHTLEGRSPARAKQPLVPKGAFVPLGAVQVARPSKDHPEIRLRFYAPAGLCYGPTDVDQRIAKADFKLRDQDGSRPNLEWKELKLPPERQILNPKSSWARYVLERAKLGPFPGSDSRNYPSYLFAGLLVGQDADSADHHGLGLVDDISDGVITCTVRMTRRKLSAVARIVVGPPDFGPTSRPPISLADNLTDRADRAAARKAEDWTLEELRDIVCDIFERAFETSHLINKDYQNQRCHWDNVNSTLVDLGRTSAYDLEQVEAMLWANVNVAAVRDGKAAPLHLAEGGERKHRRYASIEYLEMRFRENPELFDTWIRRPLDPNPFFDTRMPALMRGSDTRPWHLTRRQWELVRLWIDKLRAATADHGASPAERTSRNA